MELTSSATNKNGTGSSLASLHIRHNKAATYYDRLSNDLEANNTDSRTLASSLQEYHQQAAQLFEEALETLPDIPVKPNKSMQFTVSYIIPTAAPASTVARALKENEESFLELYKHLLDNNGLPDGIWKLIQNQSERAQTVVKKLDRISKSGAERDMRILS